MHSLNIAHRDLKVENILVSTASSDTASVPEFKLGDFGSATKDHSIDFAKATKREIGKFLSKIDKACTKMYRAPEMIDQYQGYNVDGKATDVWALGCVLYVLCTGISHPFQDATNLAILNAQYDMDEKENSNMANVSETVKDLIRAMLVTNPKERLALDQVQTYLNQMSEQADRVKIKLCAEARTIKARQLARNEKLRSSNKRVPLSAAAGHKIAVYESEVDDEEEEGSGASSFEPHEV